MRPVLTCRDVVALVTEYLEGGLDRAEHARVAGHLAACPECALFVAQIRQTIRLTGRLADDLDDDSVAAALARAVRAFSRPRRAGRGTPPRGRPWPGR